MKRILAILSLICVVMALVPAAALADQYCFSCGTYLNPNNVCRSHPTVYSNDRFRDNAANRISDLSGGMKAAAIANNKGRTEYGVYMKFTPSAGDNGYRINAVDVLVYDPWGNVVQHDHIPQSITCRYGYYWYWDFFSLDEAFGNMINTYGYVPNGVYRMEIYFNGQWAGKTAVKVQ